MELSKTAILLASAVLAILGLWSSKSSPATHSSVHEDSLLQDWSDPPPLPIFIVLNTLAEVFQSMADALTPPPVRMMNKGFAYKSARLAHLCKEFKIADFLASGPKTVQDIAEYTETENALVVERIMYAMASDGITQLDPSLKRGEEPRFVNNALSATLRLDHPNSMAGMVGHLVQDGYESFGHIEKLMGPQSEGSEAIIPWNLVHPEPEYQGGEFWKFLADHPEREEQFGRAMNSLEGLGGKAMAADVPFHRFKRIVDVGGSIGHFLHKVVERNPHMTGVLFDRPPVIETATPIWKEEGGMFYDASSRVDLVKGNFFEVDDIPPVQDGDVYLMRYILHDWDRHSCLKILSNLHHAMKGTKATLMIGESAIPERDAIGPIDVVYKIDMLMMNIFGSALERTPKMWSELLEEAGFELVTIHATRSPIHFVEAIPKP